MTLPRLYLNRVADRDRLMALEFGRVFDGQPAWCWEDAGETAGMLRDELDGRIVGFGVDDFTTFDVDRDDRGEPWATARFAVPVLGLDSATAPEIVLAARALLGDLPTVNRRLFNSALEHQPDDRETALGLWLSCLQAGDSMAHFGLGYTLYELGRFHEAYRHLRYYASIASGAPWNWCWLGRAAAAIGETGEARAAYERAIELSEDPDDTEAPVRLRELTGALGTGGIGERSDPCSGYGDGMAAERDESDAEIPVLGERFAEALQFAAATHRRQTRKGSGIPYLGHLLGVCSLVIEDGGSEDEAIAALLHDAVEDQGGQPMLDEIRGRFDEHVATIVRACSDTLETPKPPWAARKEAYLEHLEHQPETVLRVSLADKLFNARAILRDYLVVGDALWTRFSSGQDGQLWYYRQLADRFARLLPGVMAGELNEAVDALETAIGSAR